MAAILATIMVTIDVGFDPSSAIMRRLNVGIPADQYPSIPHAPAPSQ